MFSKFFHIFYFKKLKIFFLINFFVNFFLIFYYKKLINIFLKNKKIFLNTFTLNNFFLIFYYNSFILFYFILFLSFFLFFSHFYSEPCGRKALGAPARHQGCASEVGEPTLGHWSTRDLPAPRNTKWWKSLRDLHLNIKTQLHSMTSKLQCWTPYAKQLARQEHSPIH